MINKIKISLSLVLLAFVIVPLILLTVYAHPATDDFGFQMALQKSNIFDVLMGITKTMDSRVSGNFFTLLFCHADSLFYYRLQLGIFIIIFFSSVYFLIDSVNKKYFQIQFADQLILFTIFSFLFVGYMPGLSEAFYWYPGVAVWILGIVMLNLFIILILKYENIKRPALKIAALIFICFLAFAMTTQNELNLLFMFLVFLYAGWALVKKRTQFRKEYVSVFVCIGLGLLITIFSRGNYERLNYIATKQYQSLFRIIIYNLLYYRKQFFFSNVIAFNLVLLPVYYFYSPKFKAINPIKLLLYSILFLIYLTVPSLIARTSYSFRIIDFVYYFFLFTVVFNFINLANYLKDSKQLVIHSDIKNYSFFFIAFFLASYFAQKQSVLRTAYEDLYLGTARKFDSEMNNRYEYLHNSPLDTVSLKPIVSKPKSIFADDISTDPTHWTNTLYAEYFSKKSIYLEHEK